MYDLLYKVALDIVGPLLKTKDGNMYVSVTIDHYSKWCEARPVRDHDVTTAIRFLKKEIICKFGVPKFILTDNGGVLMVEFDLMCKKYGITH
jgi:transposase-like protein